MREMKQDWRDIFQAFRIACEPKKILLGLVWAYLSIFVYGVIAFVVAPKSSVSIGLAQWIQHPISGLIPLLQSLLCWVCGPVSWFKTIFWGALADAVALLLWTYFGGTILRMSAVEFIKGDVIPFREATDFAWQKKWSFFFPAVDCLIIVLVMAIAVYIGGLVCWIPLIGPLALGVGFPLALLAGFIMTMTIIFCTLGFGMMGPTVAVEGTDAFDAISRSFSYVAQKPWRFIWYNLVALAYGAACTLFLAVVAWFTVMVPVSIIGSAMGRHFAPIREFLLTWQTFSPGTIFTGFAVVLVKAWAVLVTGLVLGFIVSFFCVSQTIIYTLLRRDVDGTDMTEVYVEEEEEEPAPAAAPAETPAVAPVAAAPTVPPTAEIAAAAPAPTEPAPAPGPAAETPDEEDEEEEDEDEEDESDEDDEEDDDEDEDDDDDDEEENEDDAWKRPKKGGADDDPGKSPK
jgi:hypothetical protein